PGLSPSAGDAGGAPACGRARPPFRFPRSRAISLRRVPNPLREGLTVPSDRGNPAACAGLRNWAIIRPCAQDVPQARSTFSRLAALRASTAGMNKAMTGMCNLTPTLALVSAVLLGGLALPA